MVQKQDAPNIISDPIKKLRIILFYTETPMILQRHTEQVIWLTD